jgi:hypothetical protein
MPRRRTDGERGLGVAGGGLVVGDIGRIGRMRLIHAIRLIRLIAFVIGVG